MGTLLVAPASDPGPPCRLQTGSTTYDSSERVYVLEILLQLSYAVPHSAFGET